MAAAEARVQAPDAPAFPVASVRIGISTCLLGQRVRMDGGHCRDRWLVEALGAHVTFVPVCPEVEVGMPVPRPALRLVGPAEEPRLVVTATGEDRTEEMQAFATRRVEALAGEDLDGYVFKKSSPSCGLFRVKVHDGSGAPRRAGRGLFAARLTERFPDLPAEEEGRLDDPGLRERFVLGAFTHARFRHLASNHPTPAGLVAFHAVHKMLLLAHAPARCRKMGRLVARAGKEPLDGVLAAYRALLLRAVATRASRGRHANALQHLLGFVKRALAADEKRELGRVLAAYRRGDVALAVPLALVRYLLRRHAPDSWAARQVYLEPCPSSLRP